MCLNCKNKGYIYRFKIKERGFGSIFDQENIEIKLCRSCIKKLNLKRKWFKNKRDENGFYKYENELEELINKIGINKGLLTNNCSSSIIDVIA